MSGLLKGRTKHLLIIVAASALTKAISLAFVYALVSPDLLGQLSTKWDSSFYISIAKSGYPSGNLTGDYAFAPMYPVLIRLTNAVVGNYLLSAAVVANLFSVLVPLAFYYVAGLYFSPRESLFASLAVSFFPTFVTYGLVSYSEPVYLFFAIVATYCFLQRRYFYAGEAASVAVLSAYQNLLVPALFLAIMVLRGIAARIRLFRHTPAGTGAAGIAWRNPAKYSFVWLFLPFVVFVLWVYNLDVTSAHQFSIIAAQAPWGTSLVSPVAQFQTFFTGVFANQGDPVQMLLQRYMYTLPFFALAYPLWKIDKGLALFSSVFMLFTLSLVGTAYMSGPRLMLSAWPLILVLGKTRKEYLVTLLVLFMLLSLQGTYAQLTGFWT